MYMLILGLPLQIFSIWWLYKKHGMAVTRTTGFVFLLVCFIYHGVTEILQLFAGSSYYAEFVSGFARNVWMLYVSAAMAIFALVFGETFKPRPRADADQVRAELTPLSSLLQFGFCAVLLIGCIGIIYGYGNQGYFLSGIAAQYFLLSLLAVSAMANVYSRGRLSLLIAVCEAGVILGFTDSRLTLIMVVLCHFLFSNRHGIRHPKWLLITGAVAALLLFLTVSQMREAFGRDEQVSVRERLDRLVSGGTSLNLTTINRAIAEAASRIDGNSFGAAIFDALHEGRAGYAGFTPLLSLLRLSIPNFIDTGKHESGEAIEDKRVIAWMYAMPMGSDYLAAVFGTLYSYYGLYSLIPGTLLLALALGKIDTWLQSHFEPKGIVLWAAIFICFAFVEQGMRIIFISLRGSLLLFFGLWIVDRLAGNSFPAAADGSDGDGSRRSGWEVGWGGTRRSPLETVAVPTALSRRGRTRR